MDDKKKPLNGTFTQVPNVLLDTCDLPETAQILYLRLLRKFGYTGGTFTGSIRDLSKIVRYSKSTTDRLIKVLRDADLIRIEYDAEGAMTVILNTSELWALNKYHYEVQPSQIWDTKLPSVSELGQQCPSDGTVRASQNRDNFVSELGHDRAQSEAPKEREEKKESRKEENPSIHSFSQSSLSHDCLEKVKQVTTSYGESDSALCQEWAQRIYQRYEISDSEFHDYLYHAQAASVKTKQVTVFFEELQKMLDNKFEKR